MIRYSLHDGEYLAIRRGALFVGRVGSFRKAASA